MELLAHIIICSHLMGNCQRLDDTRGPYDTVAECEARVEELWLDVQDYVFRGLMPPDTHLISQGCEAATEEIIT